MEGSPDTDGPAVHEKHDRSPAASLRPAPRSASGRHVASSGIPFRVATPGRLLAAAASRFLAAPGLSPRRLGLPFGFYQRRLGLRAAIAAAGSRLACWRATRCSSFALPGAFFLASCCGGGAGTWLTISAPRALSCSTLTCGDVVRQETEQPCDRSIESISCCPRSGPTNAAPHQLARPTIEIATHDRPRPAVHRQTRRISSTEARRLPRRRPASRQQPGDHPGGHQPADHRGCGICRQGLALRQGRAALLNVRQRPRVPSHQVASINCRESGGSHHPCSDRFIVLPSSPRPAARARARNPDPTHNDQADDRGDRYAPRTTSGECRPRLGLQHATGPRAAAGQVPMPEQRSPGSAEQQLSGRSSVAG